MNNIPELQNQPENLELLSARFRATQVAKRIQGAFVIATIALPIVGIIVAATAPVCKPYLALVSIVLLLLEVGWLDKWQKDRMQTSAKLQEQFDEQVLSIPWNKFVAGTKVDPEDIHETAKTSRALDKNIRSWYEPRVGELPLHLASLVCQRTNISYDARLRHTYGNWLLRGSVGLAIVLSIIGLVLELKFAELLLMVFIPLTPIQSWALKSWRKHNEATSKLANFKSEVEKLWSNALSGATPNEVASGARELQNAIYQHRATSPLIPDWVYFLLRDKNEETASKAAATLIQQALSALALVGKS